MTRTGWIILIAVVVLAILWYAAGPAAASGANRTGVATRVRTPVGDSGGYTAVEVEGVQIGDFTVEKLGLRV